MTMRRPLLLLIPAIAACSDATNAQVNQLHLDRPVDIAFACYGGLRLTGGDVATKDQQIVVSAQPVDACNIRSQAIEPALPGQPAPQPPVPFGQEDLTAMGGAPMSAVAWYGLILQRGPGTVALSVAPTSHSLGGSDVQMQDADRLTPGINAVSVGEDPVAIVTDRLGCHAVIANAGSCDLSVLDITSALDNDPAVRVDRFTVTNAAGAPIRSRPAALVTEPSGGTIGNACPAAPTGLLYVAYPSCHLVAAVDSATGRIVTGIQYDAMGVPSVVGANVTCPDECGGGGGLAPSTASRPVTLDLENDALAGQRLVIGSDNSASLTVVELDADALPVSLSQIALEKTTPDLGITDLALSPTVGVGGETGMLLDDGAPGGNFQFVYAIATDHSVRVADILTVNRECDTQIDPRALRDPTLAVSELACLPIGDPTLPRRATAKGPGLRIGVPLSVDIVRSSESLVKKTQDPNQLVGYFAAVSLAGGGVILINVDDDDYPDKFESGDPLKVPPQNAISHQIRDAIFDRGVVSEVEVQDDPNDATTKHIEPACTLNAPSVNPLNGGPRAAAVPLRNFQPGNIAPEKLTELPYFRQLTCTGGDTPDGPRAITELSFSAPEAVRDREFPDLRALARDETWTLTWEGSLSLDRADSAVDGPGVRESEMRVDAGGIHLLDQTKPYCHAGVQPYDIVQLRGCDPSVGDDDCPKNYRCFVHPQSQVQGIGACMLTEEADRLATACKDFLISQRRYTVRTSSSGELVLAPRRHELKTSPLDGCTSDAQCETLADYAARASSSQHPVDDQTAADPHTWACVADPTRTPIPPNNKRCVLKCDTTDDCTTGTVCAGAIAGQAMSGFCMEGVTPPQACVNAPQRYELRAGEAFAVVGSASGFIHATIADASGACVRAPGASAYLTGRIPLNPPPCDPTAIDFTGRLPNGTFDNNPCTKTVATTDVVPIYTNPATCTRPDASEAQTTLVERPDAPGIVFRNPGMTLTLVDPYYPGDQSCVLDRQGGLGKIPLVFPGYQLLFRQVNGFSAVGLPVTSTFPVKVVAGPTESFWVIDEGDFLATNPGQSSTRGQVFRVEARKMGDPANLR
jgi:hypothetical protein